MCVAQETGCFVVIVCRKRLTQLRPSSRSSGFGFTSESQQQQEKGERKHQKAHRDCHLFCFPCARYGRRDQIADLTLAASCLTLPVLSFIASHDNDCSCC